MIERVTITVYPTGHPGFGDVFGMIFYIPVNKDPEEYIEDRLNTLLSDEYTYFWDFD